MKKRQFQVIAVLATFLIMFSVIVFSIPFQKDAFFWICYIAEVLSVALQIPVFKLAYDNREELKSKVLGFPVFRVGYIYLIVQTIASIALIALNGILGNVPAWIAVTICILILGTAFICTITVDAARDEIEKIENEQNVSTRVIKKFIIDAEGLSDMTDNPDLKKQLNSLSDEFRYSDPVSAPELEEIESTLKNQMMSLRLLLSQNNVNEARKLTADIYNNLKERNRMCKLYKY